MSTPPLVMDGYIRVSERRGREGPSYISKEVQREAIQRWAEYRGVTIAHWEEDEDYGGGTQQRPGIQRIMARIAAGETDGVAVWRLDRFARNVHEAIADIKLMQDRRPTPAAFASVSEEIDPTGPFGSFILTILLAVATLQRDSIVENWREAKGRAVKRGAKVGPTPFGYKRGQHGVLEVCEVEGPIVVEAFRLAADAGLPEAVAHLRREAPVRLRGSNRKDGRRKAGDPRNWTHLAVRRLLANRAYLGEVRYGAEGTEHALAALEAHPPLVGRAMWEAAQGVEDRIQRRAPREDFPLSGGVLTCDGCGGYLIGSRGGKDRRRVYRCGSIDRGTGRAEPCTTRAWVNADGLEAYLGEWLREEFPRFAWGTPDDGGQGRMAALEEELREAEAELAEFASDRHARKRLGAAYHAAMDSRADAVEEIQAAMRVEAGNARSRVVEEPEWDSLTPGQFGGLLRRLGVEVVVRQGGRGVREIAPRVAFVLQSDEPAPMALAQDL